MVRLIDDGDIPRYLRELIGDIADIGAEWADKELCRTQLIGELFVHRFDVVAAVRILPQDI